MLTKYHFCWLMNHICEIRKCVLYKHLRQMEKSGYIFFYFHGGMGCQTNINWIQCHTSILYPSFHLLVIPSLVLSPCMSCID